MAANSMPCALSRSNSDRSSAWPMSDGEKQGALGFGFFLHLLYYTMLTKEDFFFLSILSKGCCANFGRGDKTFSRQTLQWHLRHLDRVQPYGIPCLRYR